MAGRGAVAVQDLDAFGAGGGGSAVGVEVEGPAPAVDGDEVVEVALCGIPHRAQSNAPSERQADRPRGEPHIGDLLWSRTGNDKMTARVTGSIRATRGEGLP